MSVVPRDQVAAGVLVGYREVLLDELVVEDPDPTVSGAAGSREWLDRVDSPRRQVHHTTPAGTIRAELPTIEVVMAQPEPGPEPTDDELEQAERRRNDAIAFAVGYRDGHAEGVAVGHGLGRREGAAVGRREAFAESRAAAAAVLDRVELQLDGHSTALDELVESIAASATELALEIAEAVLARELRLSESPGVDAIARAARLLPETGRATEVVARLHPNDLAALGGSVETLLPGRSLTVHADRDVEPGGCVLESGASRVDASVSAAMARVREVLLP